MLAVLRAVPADSFRGPMCSKGLVPGSPGSMCGPNRAGGASMSLHNKKVEVSSCSPPVFQRASDN